MVGETVINVDLDGVVYDFTDAMREAFDYRFGQALLERGEATPSEWPDPHIWQTWDVWPVTRQEFYEVLYAEVLDGNLFRLGNLIDGAKEGLVRLEQNGFHIRIVTAKTFRDRNVTRMARKNVLAFLDVHDLPHHELVFSGPRGKLDFRAHVVVDDKPKLNGWVQTGALNLLFDQPWNRTIAQMPDFYERPGWLDRARNWNDVVELALNVRNQGVLL